MKTRIQEKLVTDLVEARKQVAYVVSCNQADLREARSLLQGDECRYGLNEILQTLQAWKDAGHALAESLSSEENT